MLVAQEEAVAKWAELKPATDGGPVGWEEV